MANLFLDAANWGDQDGIEPPACWNPDTQQYEVLEADEFGSAYFKLTMIYPAGEGDTIEFDYVVSNFHGSSDGFINICRDNVVVQSASLGSDGGSSGTMSVELDAGQFYTVVVSSSPDSYNQGYFYDFQAVLSPGAPPPPAQVSYNCECEDEDPTRPSQTLLQMRRRMLVRCGFANNADNPPPGTKELFDQILLDAQSFLFDEYPHFRTARFFRWPLLEGVRFYDLDANDDTCTKKLSAEHLIWVGITRLGDPSSLKGEQWEKLICGIRPEQYSGGPLQSWPTHYEIRQCIEVYPAPGPNAGYLRIKGHFGLAPFTADTDKTTLDPDLIFYHAAADYFTTGPRPDPNKARGFASLERNRLGDLVASSHQTRRYFPGDDLLPTPAPPVLKGAYQSGGA